MLWNEHFLRFFPEHADHIHAGEPYPENLRRFYRVRLPAEPQASIERYVQDGIKRHRSQVGAYMFTHRGRQLRVACVAQPNGDRVRVWQDLSAMESFLLNLAGKQDSALSQGVGPTGQQALRMFDQLSDGMAVHDEQGRIIFANDRFLAIFGLRTQEDAWGKTQEKRAISEMVQLNKKLLLESHRDALTGLLNRRGLLPLLQQATDTPGEHALLFIDLDGFKQVNDTAGHAQGDVVLCQMAAALQGCVRSGDALARIGGDEFVLLLTCCTPQQALAVAEKMVQVVRSTPVAIDGQVFQVGASVGARSFSGRADGADVLLNDADAACYEAKRQGRGRVSLFNAIA